MKKLNQASKEAMDALCEAAMDWGWQSGPGDGSTVDNAEKQFNEARTAMEKRLRYLETQLAKHRRLAILLEDKP